MTLAEQMAADASAVLLNTAEAAEEVTHRPRGDSSRDDPLTAVVALEKPQRDESGWVTRGLLSVAATLSVSQTDRWFVRGRWFETDSISPPDAGLRDIHLLDREHETTRRRSA